MARGGTAAPGDPPAQQRPCPGDDGLRIELYHPPHLFHGRRPYIETAPDVITYGERFRLHSPDAHHVMRAQMTRPMATTHSCDTEQRIVDLPFTAIGLCELDIQVADNPDLAPPGWYLLTIVDHQRRPSCATWVRLTAPH